MIDLGLTKLAVIGVVALVVIGPEKLPKVARMAGTLYGRAQRYLSQVKSEVSREIELEELRNLHKEMQDAASSVQSGVQQTIAQHVDDVEAAWKDHPALDSLSAPPSLSELERKARDFRRKKVQRNAAVPGWYKQRHGGRTHIISAAARVKKFRPGSTRSPFFQ
ncbi:Sec-independent protein translocase protein TatB [Massilia sp. TS11]|uniref:Sec-independent protein translocase protein TatB n=1 Tax=Massilia sp. TS11 TaxID=2908003 RepID=UPI001EDAB186|nr:Sec-independent protein translocase protein TatB [Massilia sp. TS11]MCG2585099.1 Sec-independent protein translocase protein TatB [Massilia sp. TS11]